MNKTDKKLVLQIAGGIVDFLKKIKKEAILGDIIDVLSKAKNTKKAMVYVPTDLRETDKKKITTMISKLVGEDVTSFVFEKDESLIDGMKIYYKDKLWDFSISSQIKKLSEVN